MIKKEILCVLQFPNYRASHEEKGIIYELSGINGDTTDCPEPGQSLPARPIAVSDLAVFHENTVIVAVLPHRIYIVQVAKYIMIQNVCNTVSGPVCYSL